MRRASALDPTEGFPHQGAMLGVKDRLAHPTISTRVNPPFRQVHPHSLATTVQLFDLSSADGTWRVFGTERPRHGSSELRYPHWFRRPHLVGHFTPNPELDSLMVSDRSRWGERFTTELGLVSSPECASRRPGTSNRLRRNATDRSVPRSLPCRARSERIDLGHSEGTRGRLRTRSSWPPTVSVTGRREVSERVRTGCNHPRGSSAAPSGAAVRVPSSCG
jgi:hypothetical protein